MVSPNKHSKTAISGLQALTTRFNRWVADATAALQSRPDFGEHDTPDGHDSRGIDGADSEAGAGDVGGDQIAPLFSHRGPAADSPSAAATTSELIQRVESISDKLATRRRDLEAEEEAYRAFEPKDSSPSRRLPPSGGATKDTLQDDFAKIEDALALKIERATQPLGHLCTMMRQTVGTLQLHSLETTQTPNAVRLKVGGGHLSRINRGIEQALREELSRDVAQINRRVRRSAEKRLAASAGQCPRGFRLAVPPLSEKRMWRRFENLLAVGQETEIELPRKGVFDILTAGRQKVFIIIMFVSLTGRMGLPDLFASAEAKTTFGVFMIAVLLGSMVNAVITWQREKAAQSEKEMTKIRETIFTAGCRAIEQAEKIKLSALRSHLKDSGKAIVNQLESAAEQHRIEQEQRRGEAEQARRKRLAETQRKSQRIMRLYDEGIRLKEQLQRLEQSVTAAEEQVADPAISDDDVGRIVAQDVGGQTAVLASPSESQPQRTRRVESRLSQRIRERRANRDASNH